MGLYKEVPLSPLMPVFLSDNEHKFVNKTLEPKSEGYESKLRQMVRRKLKVLKLELNDLHRNPEFKDDVDALLEGFDMLEADEIVL